MAKRKKKKKSDGSEIVGENSIFSLLSRSTPLSQTTEWMPTLLPGLDELLTRGKGIPFGKIIEIYGKEASGKTALSQYIMGRVQAMGGWGVYIDFELSFDKEHVKCYGIDESRIFYSVPETLEDMFSGLFDFLDKSTDYEPFVIIVDSLASAVADNEKDDDGKVQVAPVARVMSNKLRKLVVRLGGKRGFVVFINQTREKIGVMYGDRTSRPGGRALDFHAYMILRTHVKETLHRVRKGVKIPTGLRIVVTNKKNKSGVYSKDAEVVLSYDTGIDLGLTILENLAKAKRIKKRGSLYVVDGEECTKAGLLSDIRDNPEKFYKIYNSTEEGE